MNNLQISDTDTVAEDRIVELEQIESVRAFIDLAIATEDHKLIIIGWIFDPQERARGLSLMLAEDAGEVAVKQPAASSKGSSTKRTASKRVSKRSPRRYARLPVEHGVEGMQLVRFDRGDVTLAMSRMGRSETDLHGFIAVVPLAPPGAELALEINDGRFARVPFSPTTSVTGAVRGLRQLTGVPLPMILATLRSGIGEDHPLYAMARDMPTDARGGTISSRAPSFRRGGKKTAGRLGAIRADLSHLPMSIELTDMVVASIDGGIPLGERGILVFGWFFCPKREPEHIYIYDEEGNRTCVDDLIVKLSRLDVVNAYKQRFANVGTMCGFACIAPIATLGGEARALCFDFGEAGEAWIKVPSDKADVSGVALAKRILVMVADPGQMRNQLLSVFDKVLGPAIQTVAATLPPPHHTIETMQFGKAPENPSVSVIVPLYGRYDFMRHQLANFADDPDFQSTDLIYVIDDPNILTGTFELAANFHLLFKVPFRLAWYGENRGYAGANNIGVRLARGEKIVLLNSDVIPQEDGWISTLSSALDELPDAGMVGPLLQFADGSIQHAGMYPYSYMMWPGFILNKHKNRGMMWTGGNEPSEHPLITAACIMLRKDEFLAAGGFDEGYLIGDFEDSDLCLVLRKRGKRLYLVPSAKLWHLERQSQSIDTTAGVRQMVTFYNAWRYCRKIERGEIADPREVETSL